MPDFLHRLGLDDQGNIIGDPTAFLSIAFSGTLLGMSLSMAMYEVFSVSLTRKSMFFGPEGDALWEAHGGRLMRNGPGQAGAVRGFFKRLGFASILGFLALPFMPLFVMHELILVLATFAKSCFYTLMHPETYLRNRWITDPNFVYAWWI